MTDTMTLARDVTRIAMLNDLLQLDHDAVGAYSIAINALTDESRRETLRGFRADHERHIEEITRLIQDRGGKPIQSPHMPTGVFKLAVQKAGALGGEKALLLAFKANERQGRDKYRRAAENSDDLEVAAVLARASEDEVRHYDWAVRTLQELGVSPDSTAARVERVLEIGNARMADVMEGVETGAMAVFEGVRRGAKEQPLITVIAAVGVGLLASALGRRK
ncbi:MAG: ferritin-like domain-containing protein [Gemmatimonadaceae bacterium]